jgi:hypothetical protein
MGADLQHKQAHLREHDEQFLDETLFPIAKAMKFPPLDEKGVPNA